MTQEFKFESFAELVTSPITALNGVFKGTDESAITLLISNPSQGKSHLAATIALEASTGTPFLGLCASNTPKKVLVVSVEDGRNVNILRSKKKAKCLTDLEFDLTSSNLHYLHKLDALCIPSNSAAAEKSKHAVYIQRVIESVSNFDLIIVDTLTEVCGTASTILDELSIKAIFQQIATEAKVAILLVHHTTKEVWRDDTKLDMASATGITSLIKTSKLQIALTESKAGQKKMVYLKANELSEEESKPLNIEWVDGMLMDKKFKRNIQKPTTPNNTKTAKVPSKVAVPVPAKIDEPVVVKPLIFDDKPSKRKPKVILLAGTEEVNNDLRHVLSGRSRNRTTSK